MEKSWTETWLGPLPSGEQKTMNKIAIFYINHIL